MMSSRSSVTIDQILDKWRWQAATSPSNVERFKGSAFERLCIAYLTHDPLQRTQYDAPMAYGAWARQRGLAESDLGIDLVAKVRNGEGWCAIQCKFLAEGRPLRKAALDSFLAASGTRDFTRRLFIDTTGEPWSAPAEAMACRQAVPVTRVGLDQLRQSPIDWAQYVNHDKIVLAEPKRPRPHQDEAISFQKESQAHRSPILKNGRDFSGRA